MSPYVLITTCNRFSIPIVNVNLNCYKYDEISMGSTLQSVLPKGLFQTYTWTRLLKYWEVEAEVYWFWRQNIPFYDWQLQQVLQFSTRVKWDDVPEWSSIFPGDWSPPKTAALGPVNVYMAVEKSHFLVGKSTISMAMFNSYDIRLPEGTFQKNGCDLS